MSGSKLSPVREEAKHSEHVIAETEPDVGTANETIPRITNDVEGTKEQKAAVKKLSAYSDDVRKKMAKSMTNEESEETSRDDHGRDKEPNHDETKEASQQSPSQPLLSINTLTILGAVLAIGGLYFAYRADKRDEAVSVTHTGESKDTTSEKKVPDRKKRSTSKIRTLN